MNKVSAPPVAAHSVINPVLSSQTFRSRYVRYFFVGMACLFPIIALIGFAPSYQAMGNGSFQPHWFVHVHGALMSGWLLVFLAQSILAAKGKFRFHRQLGQFSAVLGVIVWLCMGTASIRARLAFPPPLEDMLWDVLMVELYAMNLFGLFFTWGLGVRKKDASAHKRLLLLATLVLMQAAIDRTQWLPGLHAGIFVRFLYLDALLIPLFLYDWLTLRRIHQVTLMGVACLVVAQLTVSMSWGSRGWHQFWFNRFAPYVEQVVEIKLSHALTAPLLGDYEDKTWKMTVSRAGGKLYLQLPGQPKWEMGATSQTEFFLKTMSWKISFIKGADDQVTKIINKQGAFTWEVPKMKQP